MSALPNVLVPPSFTPEINPTLARIPTPPTEAASVASAPPVEQPIVTKTNGVYRSNNYGETGQMAENVTESVGEKTVVQAVRRPLGSLAVNAGVALAPETSYAPGAVRGLAMRDLMYATLHAAQEMQRTQRDEWLRAKPKKEGESKDDDDDEDAVTDIFGNVIRISRSRGDQAQQANNN